MPPQWLRAGQPQTLRSARPCVASFYVETAPHLPAQLRPLSKKQMPRWCEPINRTKSCYCPLDVKRQEVVSRRGKSGHRRNSADGAVRTMPVVVMLPACQGIAAVGGALVCPGVCPLAQGRLDETLTLTVGLRTIRPCKFVPDTQFLTGPSEFAWNGTPNRCRSTACGHARRVLHTKPQRHARTARH